MSRIPGKTLIDQIIQALGLQHVQRIVIDTGLPGEVVRVYVQMVDSSRLLDVDWDKLNGPNIRITDVEKESDE